MAGDTLRGIGRKAIAEAIEAAAAAERAAETNGTAPASAVTLVNDAQARPERSLDELPSERTGYPAETPAGSPAAYPTNHAGPDTAAAMPITEATTLVADAPSVATLPGTSTLTTATTTMVDDAAPLSSSSLESRSGPNRVSFGTMLGHEMHGVQARVAVAVAEAEAGIRGTAHGRDVHLAAAHPAMAVEPQVVPDAATSSPSLGVPATAQAEPAAASTSSAKFAPPRDSLNEFSGGDHNFFATEPVNDEYEPENPRGRLYTRLAVSGFVVHNGWRTFVTSAVSTAPTDTFPNTGLT